MNITETFRLDIHLYLTKKKTRQNLRKVLEIPIKIQELKQNDRDS